MQLIRRTPVLAAALLAAPLALTVPAAAAPKVVASVKPIHSLVAGVMGEIADPRLLVEAGQSPHTYSLKPSEAQALEQADLVVWVGPVLEPFLERPVGNIARPAASFRLLRVDGLTVLRTREGGTWEGHAHDHGHDHDDGHDHDAHGEDDHEAHDEDHGHADDHDRDHDAHAGPLQGIPENEVDPHVWLDPGNARLLVQAIAARLAEIDPDNAAAYRANADATRARIDAADEAVAQTVGPVADVPYIVFHDAYQYFARHYALNAVGSITLSPDRQPGARRLIEIRDKIAELNARCVFREPQFAPDLVQTVIEGTDAQVGTLDPLGVDHAAGPGAYPRMLRDLGTDLADCLGRQG